jgi:hypothetical protein
VAPTVTGDDALRAKLLAFAEELEARADDLARSADRDEEEC